MCTSGTTCLPEGTLPSQLLELRLPSKDLARVCTCNPGGICVRGVYSRKRLLSECETESKNSWFSSEPNIAAVRDFHTHTHVANPRTPDKHTYTMEEDQFDDGWYAEGFQVWAFHRFELVASLLSRRSPGLFGLRGGEWCASSLDLAA